MLRFSALFISACTLFALPTAYAQKSGSGSSGKFDNEYLLRTQNAPGIRQNYTLEETTTVTRTSEKGDPVRYKRTIVYYITQGADAEPQKGFTTIEVNIDSMTYRMELGERVTSYDSQVLASNNPTISNTDIETHTALLNRPFTMVVSPYGEVTSITGAEIDWLKNYVLVEGRDVLDTLKKFIWLDGVSSQNAAYLADVRTNLLPFTFVKPDSVWQRTVSLRADGVDFSSAAKVQVTSLEGDVFTIEATADSLRPEKGLLYRPEREKLAESLDGLGSATIAMRLNRHGMVEKSAWSLKAQLRFREGGTTFTDTISKEYSLTLTGQFRW